MSHLGRIDRVYERVLWSCHHIARFPRSHRFTPGERIYPRAGDTSDTTRAGLKRNRLPHGCLFCLSTYCPPGEAWLNTRAIRETFISPEDLRGKVESALRILARPASRVRGHPAGDKGGSRSDQVLA